MFDLGTNTQFANNQSEVDRFNAEFYGKIKYPWAPSAFESVCREDFWRKMVAQDIGYWHDEILPKGAKIWVAGCGTNQALFTALKFPDAQIIGSDLSKESLEMCQKNASQLNINNLELRHESINEASYHSQFDYIICTGVVHHNSNPILAIKQLSKALKPSGLAEFMVYNKFHRVTTAAFQLAVRMLAKCNVKPDINKELPISQMIVKDFREENMMGHMLKEMETTPEAAFADSLLQPVEHSYTIASLHDTLSESQFELVHFCIDHFSQDDGRLDWNLRFQLQELKNLYDDLPDIERWQMTNLLQGETSPMLWFYIQRHDCLRSRKTEKQICLEFLDTKFKRTNLEKKLFLVNEEGLYDSNPILIDFPAKNKHFIYSKAKEVYEHLDENSSIKNTLEKCKINHDFLTINMIRACLATTANPYLEAYE